MCVSSESVCVCEDRVSELWECSALNGVVCSVLDELLEFIIDHY
jgi:hypothetical protein